MEEAYGPTEALMAGRWSGRLLPTQAPNLGHLSFSLGLVDHRHRAFLNGTPGRSLRETTRSKWSRICKGESVEENFCPT